MTSSQFILSHVAAAGVGACSVLVSCKFFELFEKKPPTPPKRKPKRVIEVYEP